MNGIIWLWKHRHCWEQLKYLYEHRYTLKLILSGIMTKEADGILACLRDFDGVPLARPWKVEPPGLPGSKERIEKAQVFPTTDKPNPFLERLDPQKAGIVYPAYPIRRRKDRVPLLRPVPPRPKRRGV